MCPSKTIFDGVKVGSDSLNIRHARTGGSLLDLVWETQSPAAPSAPLSLLPALPCLGNQASSCIPHPSAPLGRRCHRRDAVLPHRAHERCSSVPGLSINPTPFVAHHSTPTHRAAVGAPLPGFGCATSTLLIASTEIPDPSHSSDNL